MAEYDADELQAPAWLNDQFFENAVRSFANDPSIEIVGGCELRPATKGGDHYASIMFRTTVRYRSGRRSQSEEQTLDLVIKALPTADGFKRDLTKDSGLFETEIKMYSEVLPAMTKLLKDIGEHLEVPRLIYAASDPNAVIVLEDISPHGWLTGRECIKSFDEALYTVRNIAMLHASSLYLHETTMNLSSFNASNFITTGPVLAIFSRGFDDLRRGIEKWPGCELYVQKLKKLHETFQERWQRVYAVNSPSSSSGGYNVLNHADFQWKNLMHKKDSEGRIVDSMLIDYQCCHWGSPALDVLSLIDLIVDKDTKMTRRDEIIYQYYQQFALVLRKAGFQGKIPSLVDLQVELLRKGFHELVQASVESFKYVELTESTFDEFNAGEMGIHSCFQDKEFQRVICAELESLLHRGLLDE
ncbi:uncharacterized protein LOC109422705 [Aedes albopictus]|uniref:CHK kinase-like domain-containing protein n=1 Tax=Aedes albopictus TaxID=7160 RepID=A0ABM1ZRB5_AEDAL|nr:uncharacterized protein LOC109422705 [Aedes albopictus]